MNKIKLFLDFDSTLVDSIQAFCKTYDSIYGTTTDYTKVENYDFSPVLNISREDVNKIFADEKLFYHLRFFEGVENVLKKFEQWYSIHICTIGTARNLYLKDIWLQENATFDIKEFIGINNFSKNRTPDSPRMDKSSINMDWISSIFIDDHYKNLESSSAKTKILFKDNPNHSWSKPTEDTKYIITNWTDGKIEEILYNRIYGR